MANANTIATMNVKPRELNQGGVSTSEVAFTSDGTIPVFLPLPSSSQLSGANPLRAARFKLVAYGRVVTGTTANFTVNVYYHTSTTSATVVATQQVVGSSTVSLASLTTAWAAEIDFLWDGDSNRLLGMNQQTNIHLTHSYTSSSVSFYTQTSVDPDANGTQGFVVTGTFGTGNASNKAYLDGFQLDVI